MKAIKAVTLNVPVTYLHDTIEHIKEVMSESRYRELPVVDRDKCLRLISESDINQLSDKSLLVDSRDVIKKYVVFANEHILEAIKKIGILKTDLLPVLDEQDNYVGSVTPTELLFALNEE